MRPLLQAGTAKSGTACGRQQNAGRRACFAVRYFTSGFVGLNTPAGLSFQIHACTIQLVSAVNRPCLEVHCASLMLTDVLLSGRTQMLLCLCQLARAFGKGGSAGCPSASLGATSR